MGATNVYSTFRRQIDLKQACYTVQWNFRQLCFTIFNGRQVLASQLRSWK